MLFIVCPRWPEGCDQTTFISAALFPLRALEGDCHTGSQSQPLPVEMRGMSHRAERRQYSYDDPYPLLPLRVLALSSRNNKNPNFLAEACTFTRSRGSTPRKLAGAAAAVIWPLHRGSVGESAGRLVPSVKDGRQLLRTQHFCLPDASRTILPSRSAGRARALTVLLMDLGRLSSRIGPRSSSVSPKSSVTRRGSLKSGRACRTTHTPTDTHTHTHTGGCRIPGLGALMHTASVG